jgi:hypothetical protein
MNTTWVVWQGHFATTPDTQTERQIDIKLERERQRD